MAWPGRRAWNAPLAVAGVGVLRQWQVPRGRGGVAPQSGQQAQLKYTKKDIATQAQQHC